MSNSISVLIIEDEKIVGEALRALLEEAEGIEVIAEAPNAATGIAMARQYEPDVILVDLLLPDKSGIQVIEEIIAENRSARILVLTAFSDDSRVAAAFQAGALGYLLKTQATTELVQAIQTAARGLSSLHPAIATKLVRQLKRPVDNSPNEVALSDPEERVLVYVARGLTNQEIAEELSISLSMVRTHVSRILSKLALENRTQAAIYALKKGLLSLNEVRIAPSATREAGQLDPNH